MLVNVGRTAEALEQLHQANDMLALYLYTPLTLAEVLVVAGKPDEAKRYFDAAIDLAPNADTEKRLATYKAVATGDVNLLQDATLTIPEDLRAALLQGYRAQASPDSGAKAQAVEALLALTEDQQSAVVAKLLADLGAHEDAFRIANRLVTQDYPPALFFDRRMRGTLADPGFPEVAKQLGLLNYWTTTQTMPDVCHEAAAPPFCEMI